MALRKTVARETVVGKVNTLLTLDTVTREQRVIVATLLESILFAHNDYHGFRYQSSELTADGPLRADYDDTRRIYY